MENLIIPSAIQRIRSFLIEMCGMKVKPWATTEETLAALHTTLVARHRCEMFWTSLRGLLEALAHGLKMRQEALPGTLVDNELLDSERYATLLDEIRAALALQTAGPASFRRLASALSAPALGLLLFLGGAASVGCDRAGLRGPAQAQDASRPDVVDTGNVQPTSPPDASIRLTLPDAPPASNVVDARVAKPEANPDIPPVNLTTLDARPAADAVAPSQSDGAAVTIQDIMDSCNIPDQTQQQVLTCLARLGYSWDLAAELAGLNCSVVGADLDCFVRSICWGTYEITFPSDPNTPWICKPIIIYAGVSFV